MMGGMLALYRTETVGVVSECPEAEMARIFKNGTELKSTAWLREHGPANKMTLVSNDAGKWDIHCDACGIDIRGTGAAQFQQHAERKGHAAALQSGCGSKLKLTAWLREHGPANQMTLLSSGFTSSGARVSLVRCGACSKDIRIAGAAQFQQHTGTAKHAAALEGCAAHRKRSRS
jgi:hypothetical protein